MFGGHGLYVDELFVALIADEVLYLKADRSTQPQFEAAGCTPFVYTGKGREMTLQYWRAPDEAMESPALMLPWARLALRAALAARTSAATRQRKTRAPAQRRPR
jgi:DNA transformation protein